MSYFYNNNSRNYEDSGTNHKKTELTEQKDSQPFIKRSLIGKVKSITSIESLRSIYVNLFKSRGLTSPSKASYPLTHDQHIYIEDRDKKKPLETTNKLIDLQEQKAYLNADVNNEGSRMVSKQVQSYLDRFNNETPDLELEDFTANVIHSKFKINQESYELTDEERISFIIEITTQNVANYDIYSVNQPRFIAIQLAVGKAIGYFDSKNSIHKLEESLSSTLPKMNLPGKLGTIESSPLYSNNLKPVIEQIYKNSEEWLILSACKSAFMKFVSNDLKMGRLTDSEARKKRDKILSINEMQLANPNTIFNPELHG